MGIVSRFERRLQGAVGDGLARMFGGGVVPAEVEAALQREAEDRLQELGGGHLLAPNSYLIALSRADYDQLAADHDLTVRAFSKHLQDYIRDQGWQTYGDIRVTFEPSPTLHTGQFRTTGTVDPDVGRPPPDSSRRPFARPTANPLSGAGPMTQNSGYDPRREPADSDDRRGRAEYPNEPRSARGFATPLSGGRGGYQNGGGGGHPQPEPGRGDHGRGDRAYSNGYDQAADYPNGYDQPPSGGYSQVGYDRGQQAAEYDRGGYAGDQGYGAAQGQGYGDRGGYGAEQQGYAERDRYDQGGYGADQAYGDRGGYAGDQGYGEQGYDAPQSYDKSPAYPSQGERGDRGGYGQSGYAQQPPAYEPRQSYGHDAGYGQQAPAGRGGQAGNYPSANAPAPGGYAGGYTASLQLDDGSGRTYQLREGSNIIGRGQDAHFRLPDTGVSRRHIEVRWDGQVAMLSDLGSTNGTLVNGSPVQDWQLADGDVIRAGHSEILIRIL